ncbi:MarR family winged helix-turn-helix transcriptional regulator [Kibdelosporangium phytohabitans]|uniref:MarR family transcriptional regulator n=1 Tax=Kibdelosporangium phytohabitans TaxID=860235 RepID=A0A0N9I2M7_9PSEU|nr:MarR family transcriptional regulator [Kibdelosporangium phytohabitans]ALG08724.1 MarR family transcriptional regulator [Kibdelosporangium phytohabitans]MBE1470162.1 DNA-binding MarR family transcriptional regulator [Kibdelosporangium phytohabitans]
MTADNPATAVRLLRLRTRLLSLASIHSDRRVNEALGEVGARKWHYAVLATLEEFGPASQADLSDRTRIYRSDLVNVITELAAQDLVERSPNPADRRQNVISLTGKGTDRLLELDKVLRGAEEDFLAPLDAGQREQLGELLAILTRDRGH